MRGVKCKWYDDAGKPITGGGCRQRHTCTYAHPNEPDWESARRRLYAHPEYKGPLHAPYKSKDKEKDFDDSGWRKSSQENQTRKNLGWSVAAPDPKEMAASSSSSWRGDSGGSAGASKGWGAASGSGADADTGGGWGAGGGSSGWGVSGSGGGGTEAGWGAWGADKDKDGGDNVGGWGAPIPGSTWDSKTVPPPKPPSTLPPSLPSRNSSFTSSAPQHSPNMSTDPRPRPRPPTQTISGAGLISSEAKGKGKEREIKKPSMNVAISEKTTTRLAGGEAAPRTLPTLTQPNPSPSIIPMGPPPVPPAKAMPPPPPADPTTAPTDKDTLLSQAGALKRKSSTVQPKGDPKKSILKLSHQERIDKYRSVIKHIFVLVYIQICLKKAKATEENWKRNNSSEHYSKSTQITRKKLENGRREAAERTQDLRRQRAENIHNLLALPDVPSRSHRPYDPDADRQKVMKYTLELRNWVNGLDLPNRLAAFRQPPSIPTAPATEKAIGSQKDVSQSVVDQLDSRAEVSIEEVYAAINTLDARVKIVEEEIYMTAYTKSDVEDAIEEFQDGFLKKRDAARLKKLTAVVAAQSEGRANADATLRQALDEASAVNDQIQSLQAALKDLKAKAESLNKSNEETERMIQEAENKQQERSNLVKELSEQLIKLTLTRKSPRPVREVTIDDIAPEIQQEIVDQVKAQLKPVMEGMIAATRDAGEKLKEEVDKIVSQVVEKTAELTATATAARVEHETLS